QEDAHALQPVGLASHGIGHTRRGLGRSIAHEPHASARSDAGASYPGLTRTVPCPGAVTQWDRRRHTIACAAAVGLAAPNLGAADQGFPTTVPTSVGVSMPER